MRLRIAVLLLWFPLGRATDMGRWALDTVLRHADSGVPVAMRAVAHAVKTRGHDAVWRGWLETRVAGRSSRRWASAPAELTADAATVPGWVIDAVWSDWLDKPDAAPWLLLKQWNRPATASAGPRTRLLSRLALGDRNVSPEPVLLAGTAARFDHPVGELARARLLTPAHPEAVDLYCAMAVDSPGVREFCVARGLAPSDEVECAMFFVRTGQYEQYQALDPDGVLLALGYRSASTAERATLRTAMAALSGIDTLRILAGQRSDRQDFFSLSKGERNYLVRQLTHRGDWERLWRLVPLMTLPDAVETIQRFGTWQPSIEDDRELFEALRTADPLVVNDGLSAVSAMPPYIEPIQVLSGESFGALAVHALDFSADGRQLAFVGSLDENRFFAGTVDLRSRRITQFHDDFVHPLSQVAHLGPDTIVVAEDPARTAGPAPARKLYHVDPGGVRPLAFKTTNLSGLRRIAGDREFLVAAQQRSTAAAPRFEIFLGAADGRLTESHVLRGRNGFQPWGTAVAPGGRLAAVFDAQDIVAADLADGTVNALYGGPVKGVLGQAQVALSPFALVRTTLSGDLRVWHDPLTSRLPPAVVRGWSRGHLPTGLAWSPALHRFVTVRNAHLEILAVPPTPDVPMPGELVHERIELVGAPRERPRVQLSPKGDVLAVVGDGPTVSLYDLAPQESAFTRSIGSLNRQDVAEVTRLQRHPGLGHTAQQVLALLLACLEYRFRHDIWLGDATSVTGLADTEIELGEG